MSRRPSWLCAAWLAACVASTGAGAAGGHHAVDDAALLEPGQCEIESWVSRSASERLLHGGAGCRVGPVELGLAAERLRGEGERQTGYGLQVKWAQELQPGLSAGAVLASSWQADRPRHQGVLLAGLVSWAPRDDLALHLNIGRDFVRGGRDQNRSGIAAEWTVASGWSVLGERYYEDRTHLLRAGLRWTADAAWSVDVSRAHRLRGPGESAWTVGLTLPFGRP